MQYHSTLQTDEGAVELLKASFAGAVAIHSSCSLQLISIQFLSGTAKERTHSKPAALMLLTSGDAQLLRRAYGMNEKKKTYDCKHMEMFNETDRPFKIKFLQPACCCLWLVHSYSSSLDCYLNLIKHQ